VKDSDLSTGQLFALAARLAGSLWVRQINDGMGIGWTAYNVLRQLESEDGRTAREIAAATMVAGSTLTGVLDTLDKDGLVERRRSATDRRVVHVHLTAAGRDRLASSAAAINDQFDGLFKDFGGAEAEVRRFLRDAIDRFSAELGVEQPFRLPR
jgi:DNA-binding MarR family transcriptional regulator